MSQGQIVKRSWSKKSQISEHTDILDIWDTGSHIYERWPNGNECYWKVISRDLSDTGFTERLEKMPQWKMPGQVIRREQIPLLQVSDSHFELGGWSVEQEAEGAYNIALEGGKSLVHKHMRKPQAHNAQAQNAQAQRHKHKASLPRVQMKGQQQPSQRYQPQVI